MFAFSKVIDTKSKNIFDSINTKEGYLTDREKIIKLELRVSKLERIFRLNRLLRKLNKKIKSL